jgi:hypothetical protein
MLTMIKRAELDLRQDGWVDQSQVFAFGYVWYETRTVLRGRRCANKCSSSEHKGIIGLPRSVTQLLLTPSRAQSGLRVNGSTWRSNSRGPRDHDFLVLTLISSARSRSQFVSTEGMRVYRGYLVAAFRRSEVPGARNPSLSSILSCMPLQMNWNTFAGLPVKMTVRPFLPCS